MRQYVFVYQPPYGPDAFPSTSPLPLTPLWKGSDGTNAQPLAAPHLWHVPHTVNDAGVLAPYAGRDNWLDLEPYEGFWSDPNDQMGVYAVKAAAVVHAPVTLVLDPRRVIDGTYPQFATLPGLVRGIALMLYWTDFQVPVDSALNLIHPVRAKYPNVPIIPIFPFDAPPMELAYAVNMIRPWCQSVAYWRYGTSAPEDAWRVAMLTQSVRAMLTTPDVVAEGLSNA